MPASMAASQSSFKTKSSIPRGTKPIGGEATTADIVAANIAGGKKKSMASRLNSLVDQFQAFYGGLEVDVVNEYEEQEDRITAVERYVLRLEKSLVVEQERRIEMLTHVENNLKQQFHAVRERNFTQVAALKPVIPARIEQWHARLAMDEEMLDEERIARGIAIEKERLRLLKQLDDFQARLEIEKVERLEREALTMKKVTDASFPMQEAIADERNRRESTLGHLRDENDAIDAMRDKPDNLFKEALITRMVRSTRDIKLETSVRVAAEQQFVSSLESYTKALQEGLRMVNKQVDEQGSRRTSGAPLGGLGV